VPFWATRVFRWNLILCALMLSAAAIWMLFIAPWEAEKERVELERAHAAMRFVPRDPSAPREVRFDGKLERAVDNAPLELFDSSPGEPYNVLVRHLSKADPAVLAEQARMVDYPLYEKMPSEIRGQTVRLNALFVKAPRGPERLKEPIGGVEMMTRAYLINKAGDKFYIVDFVEPPPPLEPETPVTLDAVYLQQVSYETNATKEGKPVVRRAPIFVARSLGKAQVAPSAGGYRYKWLVVMMAVAMFLGLAFLTVRAWLTPRLNAPRLSPLPRKIAQ
jgi:hypothetical protein